MFNMVFIIIGITFVAACLSFALVLPFMVIIGSLIGGLATAGLIAAAIEATEKAEEDGQAWFDEIILVIETWFEEDFMGFFTEA